MTPRQLLGVFVRAAGLWSLLYALFDVYYIWVKMAGFPTASTAPIERDVMGMVIWSVLGVGILFGAPWIVRVAYWRDDSN